MTTETVTCVGALVLRRDSLLAIRQAAGHPLQGQWTFPWGRLDPGESPSQAAIREVAEEAGVIAEVRGLVGVQELPHPWTGWNALVYLCEHVDGDPAPDNREADAARYFTLAQLDELAEPVEVWSRWLMARALRDELTVIEPTASNPYGPGPGFL